MNTLEKLSLNAQRELNRIMNCAKRQITAAGNTAIITSSGSVIRVADYCLLSDKEVSAALGKRPRAQHTVYIIEDGSHKITVMDHDGEWLPMSIDGVRGLEERGNELEPRGTNEQIKMIDLIEKWLTRNTTYSSFAGKKHMIYIKRLSDGEDAPVTDYFLRKGNVSKVLTVNILLDTLCSPIVK